MSEEEYLNQEQFNDDYISYVIALQEQHLLEEYIINQNIA